MIEHINALPSGARHPTFADPDGAIAHAKNAFINVTLVGESIADCLGRAVEAADWNDTALRLHIADGFVLTFRLHDRKIDADVGRAVNAPALEEGTFADPVVVRLGTHEFIWDRAALVRAMVGKQLARLQLSGTDAFNFLYVSDFGILLLSGLIDGGSGRAFMSWGPSD